MIGAVIGDMAGSTFEFNNIKTKDFALYAKGSRFTDDTVLTMATLDSLLNAKPFVQSYKKWYRKYPNAGYGKRFIQWAESSSRQPYNSWGNGSAMRVSPIGLYCKTVEQVMDMAKESAETTHNHPEGIKGAQAAAAAVFLAGAGKNKEQIKNFIEDHFGYDLNEPLTSIRRWYKFDVSCQGSIPQAIIAFLEATGFEDAIRNAVSIGGDSDTIACITGAIAEAYFQNIPERLKAETLGRLDGDMVGLLNCFYHRVGKPQTIA